MDATDVQAPESLILNVYFKHSVLTFSYLTFLGHFRFRALHYLTFSYLTLAEPFTSSTNSKAKR